MEFSNPKKNLEQFDIAPGQKIVDFGAGAGYYTFAVSRLVGFDGTVIALDVQKDLLLTIKREANKAHLFNIETITADLESPMGSKLKEGSMERGLVCNFLFQIKNKQNFIKEVGRVIKSGGKVLVVDWTDSFGGIGPDKRDVFPKDECRKLFLAGGFEFEREIDAGMHHYGFVFKKV